MDKKLEIKNLVKLNWRDLIKSKTFWVGIILAIYGIYNGQYELVVGAAGVITLRDAVSK